MLTLFIASFIAGVLTVLAPCILPLLPVIIGGTSARGNDEKRASWLHPVVIAGSLAGSVIIFTLLLKATTALLGVPQEVWRYISGVIVLLLGVHFLYPELWERLPGMSRFNIVSNKALGNSYRRRGIAGDVLIGASLGPVFSSCSPTYALIVATVLPSTFFTGLLYLSAYAVGLAGALLVIAFAGRAAVGRLGWLSNPKGLFHKVIGGIFIVVALSVLFGLDKHAQTYVLERGWYDPIGRFEESFR